MHLFVFISRFMDLKLLGTYHELANIQTLFLPLMGIKQSNHAYFTKCTGMAAKYQLRDTKVKKLRQIRNTYLFLESLKKRHMGITL